MLLIEAPNMKAEDSRKLLAFEMMRSGQREIVGDLTCRTAVMIRFKCSQSAVIWFVVVIR